jgi:precorrin-6A/cobalt-precorrin-6A reductase
MRLLITERKDIKRQMKLRILILGGTAEGRLLAEQLRAQDIVLSLAGRTRAPLLPDVPVRIGGFGGAHGLADYIQREAIGMIVDATHPYAARMSANAVEAAALSAIPLLQLRRLPWQAQEKDNWIDCADASEAVQALGHAPQRVFLALGRQELELFRHAPQHHYVVRSVDPVEPLFPHADYITARGPFSVEDDLSLFKQHRISGVVSKNSGGTATFSKILAARQLGLPVYLLARPILPDAIFVESIDGVISWVQCVARQSKSG